MFDPFRIGEASTRDGTANPAIAASTPATPLRCCLAQLTELAPRRDERVLRDVLAEAPATGRAVRDRAHHVLIALDQLPERRPLAAPAGFDQLGIGARFLSHVVHTFLAGAET